MPKLKIEIDHAQFTYYKGLASMIGMDLATVAHRGMMRELQSIEKAVFTKQAELADLTKVGVQSEAGTEVTEGTVEVRSEATDSPALADTQDASPEIQE